MEIELAYGNAGLTLALSPEIAVDEFEAARIEHEVDLERFREACQRAGADEFLSEEVLVVVNDGHRSTPSAKVLAWLDKTYDGVIDRAHFLVATGAHSAPTREHLARIFGEFYERVVERVTCHVANDLDTMSRVGSDNRGGEVYVNRQFLESRRVCLIGSVEPHYFAGFTGGRKGICPGLSDLATIERNHNLANSLDASPLRIQGNPVAEHLQEVVDLIDTSGVFSIQLVVDAGGKVGGVYAGSLEQTFSSAMEFSRSIYAHRLDKGYDAVLCEMLPPLDGNLYQAQKGLENCQEAVVNGGSAIIVSACESGVGSEHFFELADRWDPVSNLAVDGEARFGSHKLSRVIGIGGRIEVRLHSRLHDDTVRHVFFEPVGDISAYLEQKARGRGKYRLAVVHDAGHTVLTRQIN